MQKSKQRILLIGLMALLIVGGSLFLTVPYTLAAWWNPLDWPGYITGYAADRTAISMAAVFIEIFKFLIRIIVIPIVVPIAEMMMRIGLAQSDYLVNHSFAQLIWQQLLNVANGVYLLALFIASIAIILRINVGVYNLKKFLGGFITAVALSNLSLLLVRAMISLANLLNNIFYQLYASFKGIDAKDSLNNIMDFLIALTKQRVETLLNDNPFTTDFTSTARAITEAIILGVVIWIMVKLGLLLLERIARLFLSAITAPVVFALGLLPNFSKLTGQWWENILKWLLVLPATLGVIVLSLWAFNTAGIKNTDDATHLGKFINPVEITDQFKDHEPSSTEQQAVLGSTLLVLVGLMGLWAAGNMNKSLNLGGTLAGHVETPQKALQAGQGLYKKGADFVTGKSPIYKGLGGARRLSGTALDLATNKDSKFGKMLPKQFQGLGTTIGSYPAAFKKGIGAYTKSKEQEAITAANKTLSQAVEKLPTGTRKQVLAGLRTDTYKAINEQTGTYGGYDATVERLLKATDIQELNTAMGVIDRFSNSNTTPMDDRGKLHDFARDVRAFSLVSNYGTNPEDETAKKMGLTRTDVDRYNALRDAHASDPNSEKGQLFTKLTDRTSKINALDKIRREEDKMRFSRFDNTTIDRPHYRGDHEEEGEAGTPSRRPGGGGAEFNHEELIRALSNLSKIVSDLSDKGISMGGQDAFTFANATRDANSREMVLALRKLAKDKGISSSSSSADATTAIDGLEADGDTGASVVSALRDLVSKGMNVGKLADGFGKSSDGDTDSLAGLIDNLKSNTSVSIQQSANIDDGVASSYTANINEYLNKEGVDLEDLEKAVGSWISNIGNKGASPATQTAIDAGIGSEKYINDVLDTFKDHFVKLRVGGDTATADNVTVGELREVLGNAAATIHRMKK